ncbi:hypothetical protein [Salipiger mangrovisoli]|uniref:hypothetical protein n=1 Tax=Salipiger mangrovisoli TaxID=2865933 RepID=UPI0030B83B28
MAKLRIRHARKIAGAAILASELAIGAPRTAQAYQVDCAILICLAGGWPSTAECAEARETFIERITPSPIEPPLQIWNCPLGASYDRDRDQTPLPRLVPIAARSAPDVHEPGTAVLPSVLGQTLGALSTDPMTALALAAQDGNQSHAANVDISGPEFDFVRSIRVYHVALARQREIGSEESHCRRTQNVQIGTYGEHGAFGWSDSSVDDLPAAFEGLDGWGEDCPSIHARAVFVDWRDYSGSYGFEQVNY